MWKSQCERRRRALVVSALLLALFTPVSPVAVAALDPLEASIPDTLRFSARQLDTTAHTLPATDYPAATTSDGSWNTNGPRNWASGFLPGSFWLMYEHTGEPQWRLWAQRWQAGLESQKDRTDDQDLGFLLFTSFGNGYRLTREESYRRILLTAADSFSQRYDARMGLIRSRGDLDDTEEFEVIIDTLMNVELLFWASRHGGNHEWYEMAHQHALSVLKSHVRADGGTYQTVSLDPKTGAVLARSKEQGCWLETSWSRGQGWAVYGFTMAYRETRDPRLLEAARLTADYAIRHLPGDGVPYWDFQAPGIPREPRDSSAAAILASALVELSQLEPDPQRAAKDWHAARTILRSLSSPEYLGRRKPTRAILLHGTAYRPHHKSDTGLIHGDYYFLEALLRYSKAQPPRGAALAEGRPHAVRERTPVPDAINVPLGTDVTVTFSEEVADVDGNTLSLWREQTRIDATVSHDATRRIATLDPREDLAPGAVYTVRLTRGGPHPPTPLSWTFTTVAVPPPSAQTRILHFEDGELSAPASGVDAIQGPVKRVKGEGLGGAYAIRLSDSAPSSLEQRFLGTGEVSASFSLRVDALPSSKVVLVAFAHGDQLLANLVLLPSGELQLRNDTLDVGPKSNEVRQGGIYRLHLRQRRESGSYALLEASLSGRVEMMECPFASSRVLLSTPIADRLLLGGTDAPLSAVVDDLRLETVPP
ncbi:unsaturated chondroitin disaccharide hydrolase [Archangium gephyra]|uniref:Unsaturated chondroitin disaccharide hydrolase n=1 Tax=Archangium gephyra TaxID=48 RepID=A0ABX9K7J3_9BACT|nr:unsaturated chondroitin disaccharide hydrolase [Archangium gephyra]